MPTIDTDVVVGWIDADSTGNPKYSAEAMRALFSLFFAPGERALTAKEGKLTGLEIRLNHSQLTVTPGAGIVTTSRGSFTILLLRKKTLSLQPAHPSYLRKDLLILRAKDVGAERGGNIEIITGEPGVSPSAPTTPDGALALAVIDIPSNGSASLLEVAESTHVAGAHQKIRLPDEEGCSAGENYFVTGETPFLLVSATASNASSAAWCTAPQDVSGQAMLQDDLGEYWIAQVANSKLRILGKPPKGRRLHGAIPLRNI